MTEQEKRLHRVCFTGHRPDKLGVDTTSASNALAAAIDEAIATGMTTFITGMCPGIDILAAEIILARRSVNNRIKLIAAMPYPGFAFTWADGWGQHVQNVLAQVDFVKYVSSTYTGRGVFQVRNEWMVNHSARIIAYWNGTPGGTRNTVNYARKAKIEFINCYR